MNRLYEVLDKRKINSASKTLKAWSMSYEIFVIFIMYESGGVKDLYFLLLGDKTEKVEDKTKLTLTLRNHKRMRLRIQMTKWIKKEYRRESYIISDDRSFFTLRPYCKVYPENKVIIFFRGTEQTLRDEITDLLTWENCFI